MTDHYTGAWAHPPRKRDRRNHIIRQAVWLLMFFGLAYIAACMAAAAGLYMRGGL